MPVIKPIFIVGCGRSGTTLLFNMLSCHPAITRTTGYPDGEDHVGWIKHGSCVMSGLGNANSNQYGSGINGFHYCLHMTKDDASDQIVENMRAYYWNEVLKQDQGKRVLNKQPHLSNKIGYLLKIFPDAKIIHIIRDCEAVVASWIAMMQLHPSFFLYWPEEEFPCFWLFPKTDSAQINSVVLNHDRIYPGAGAKRLIDYWIKVNENIVKQMQHQLDQLCVIRYEDLVENPEAAISRLCQFCDLPIHTKHNQHIETSTSKKYLNLLTPELKSDISQRASQLRAYFGYAANKSHNKIYPNILQL